MKKIQVIKYKCPDCKTIWEAEEWTDKDPLKIESLKCYNCKDGQIFTSFTPPWIGSAKVDPGRMDAQSETKATEYMLSERAKEMKMSAKSRSWEKGRKDAIMSYKSTWIKNGRKTKDLPKI